MPLVALLNNLSSLNPLRINKLGNYIVQFWNTFPLHAPHLCSYRKRSIPHTVIPAACVTILSSGPLSNGLLPRPGNIQQFQVVNLQSPNRENALHKHGGKP